MPFRAPKRFAGTAVAVAAIIVILAVMLLGGSRTPTADAAILTRAKAALDQPGTIFYVQEHVYEASGGGGIEMLGGNGLAGGAVMCVPSCLARPPATGQTGISADPADDTLTYSFQEWLSPDASQDHTIYNNGDETADTADEYSAYDAADNTLTILTDAYPDAPAPSSQPSNVGAATFLGSGLTDLDDAGPSFYEQLYQEAQAGDQATSSGGSSQTTVTSQLIGQTTIDGEAVYELSFDVQSTVDANAGALALNPQQILVYLDSQTYTPVRTVEVVSNPHDNPGSPAGTTVAKVIDYTMQSLPDTPANEALLQIAAPPGATTIQETMSQYRAAHGFEPAPGPSGSTGTSGATDATGSSGTSGSGASGASSTTTPG
jgi:hypothetical protein